MYCRSFSRVALVCCALAVSVVWAPRPAAVWAQVPPAKRKTLSVVHLDAEEMAPSRAALLARLKSGLIRMPGSPTPIRRADLDSIAEPVKQQMREASKKAADEKRAAAAKQKADDEKVQAAVDKALAEKDKETAAQKAALLNVTLSPQQTYIADKAYIDYVGATKVDMSSNTASFNQTVSAIETTFMGPAFRCENYAMVQFQAKKGRVYYVSLKANSQEGLAVYNQPSSAQVNRLLVLGHYESSFVVTADTEGWYSLVFGIEGTGKWSLGPIAIKEIEL